MSSNETYGREQTEGRLSIDTLLSRAGWGSASAATRDWWERVRLSAEEAGRPDWLIVLLEDVIAHGMTLNEVVAACRREREGGD